MKTSLSVCGAFVLAVLLPQACDMKETPLSEKGFIRLNFAPLPVPAAALSAIPDTDSFILDIRASDGKSVYHGRYGDAPDSLFAAPGDYAVSVRSVDFEAPGFDAPQYGADRLVSVVKGGCTGVELVCTQLNAGVRLYFDVLFRYEYPDADIFLESASGSLMYGLDERRTAYFKPGVVNMKMRVDGSTKTLVSRTLEARQMLSLTLSASGEELEGLTILLDTTREWIAETYTVGGRGGGSDYTDAIGVAEARLSAPAEDVWVCGYIVGGDLSSGKCSFEPPFSSATNLVLAAKSSCKSRDLCLSVQLAKGDVRDALNLVDHPDLLGSKVWLKGDLVASYYGLPGLQAISDFKLQD